MYDISNKTWLGGEEAQSLGAIHLWHPHRGCQALADTWGWGVSSVWTSTQKNYSPLTSSCLLLVQKSWNFLDQNFVFWRN